MLKINFKTLWKNYPDKNLMKTKCRNKQKSGSKPFSDYCAIMLSECLIRSGASTIGIKAKKCWSHPGMKHILLAEDLANWLERVQLSGIGKREKIDPEKFQEELKGRTGIIFFKDYWKRGGESFDNRSGDHIDLWNEDEITSSSMFTRAILEFFRRVSDLNDSKEVWFWEVK